MLYSGKGPRATSIANDPHFREYVHLRHEEQAVLLASRTKGHKPRSALSVAVEGIRDEGLRAPLRRALIELDDLRKWKQAVSAVLRLLDPGLNLDHALRQHQLAPGKAVQVLRSTGPLLPPDGIAALGSLLALLTDANKLRSFGFRTDGARVTRERPMTDFISNSELTGLKALHAALMGRKDANVIDVQSD